MAHKPQTNLNRLVFFYLLTIALVSIFTAGTIWLFAEYNHFSRTIEKHENEFHKEKQQTLKQEVGQVLSYIDFMKAQTESRLKHIIKTRTYEAYAIASHIYQENKDNLSTAEIKKLVKDALRPIRFNNGRGYYFATGLDGTEELFADRPELEGTNLLLLEDTRGNYVIKEMIDLVKNDGEGFYQYYWSKPDMKGIDFPKMAFIKYFEPFDWFIGTGEYLDSVVDDIQAEVISRIEKIRFGRDGYVFVGSMDGISLAGPAKGKNMLDITDPKGVKIVQELIKVAKNGGGFVRYTMPDFEGMINAPKLSYAVSIDEWGWYIGAGIYIGEIETIVAGEKRDLKERVLKYLVGIILILLTLSFGIILLAKFMSGRLKSNFDQFARFFRNAADQHTKIDTDLLDIKEFTDLAQSANHMIDARKKIEYELQENKKWVDTIFRSIQSGIMVIDADTHTIHEVNPEAARIIGAPKEEIIGKECHDFVCQHQKGQCPIIDMGKRAIKEEREIITIQKKHVPIIKSAALVSMSGKTYIIESFVDITEKKALEEQLRQSEKMQALGTLAGGIAHDFNNLMMGIEGRISIMKHEDHQTDIHTRHLESISECIRNASDLTTQLLGIARGGKYNVTPTDINIIVHQQVMLFGRTKKEIQIKEHFDSAIWAVDVDRNQMIQVFWNLFINAAHAMPRGGTIDITTKNHISDTTYSEKTQGLPAGKYINLSIQDNGVGMDKETLQRAFDPFFTTREKERGTGLGLASVYGIIKNHNGHIDITSEPDAGTTVSIFLPASDKAAVHIEEKSQKIETGTGTILLIDDEKMVREVGCEMLKRLGYDVMSASGGEEALEVYRQHHHDIKAVVLDMIMPGMNGSETYEKLRSINAEVTVLLSSGYSRGSDTEELLCRGCKGFIQKPFNLESLSSELAQTMA